MGVEIDITGYRIKEELGRGGMATVYLAVQESVLREVALKVMSPVLRADPSFGERFMREARIAANLHHRHVVAIHDVGVQGDYHYIAMEYLSGGDIKARFRAGMSLDDCLRVTMEIAEALDYAHAKGFVHRDIKPDNVLFREDGSAVLTDFGIARATDSSTQMTRTGAVVGTPHYMSPEQARGRPLDHRSDLYSLGIVFYEMATGHLPYEAGDSLAVGIKHITEPIPTLPERLEDLQPFLERILAKDRERRYQTGAAVASDIRELRADLKDRLEAPLIVDAPPPKRDRAARTVVLDRPTVGGRREPTLGAIDTLDPEMAIRGDYHDSRFDLLKSIGLGAVAGVLLAGVLGWFLPGEDGWAQTQWRVWRASNLVAKAERSGVDAEEARDYYQRALELDPESRNARQGLARLQTDADDVSDGFMLPDRTTTLVDLADPASVGQSTSPDPAPTEPEFEEPVGAEQTASQGADATDSEPAETALSDPVETAPAVDPIPVQIASLLEQAEAAMAAGRLVGDRPGTAVALYRAVLTLDPENEAAAAGVEAVAVRLVGLADSAIERGNVERAQRLLDEARVILPGLLEVRRTDARITAFVARNAPQELTAAERDEFNDLMYSAGLAMDAGQLMSPPGDSAYDFLKAALAMQPADDEVRAGLRTLSERLASRARESLDAGQVEKARDELQAARQADGANPELNELGMRIAASLRESVIAAIEAGDLDRAESLLAAAGAMAPADPELEILARRIAIERD